MYPLLLLSSICFSDITHHSGCDQVQQANIQYYHLTNYSDGFKNYIESGLGKPLVNLMGTIGYTAYKKSLTYKFNSCSINVSNEAGSLKYSWSW